MAPPFKMCATCRTTQVSENFGSDSARKDGKNRECRKCAAKRTQEWRKKHGNQRAKHLQAKYKLSLEQYEILLAKQGGGCWICGDIPKEGKHLDVDHDHQSRKVRGLLCHRCNKGLGGFRDRLDLLNRAFGYIALFKTVQPTEQLDMHYNVPALKPYPIIVSNVLHKSA